MKKKLVKKPVIKSKMMTPQEELALQIFSEYANSGSSDILVINKTKNLLFLDDYNYTLDRLRARCSFSRMSRIIEEDYIDSL